MSWRDVWSLTAAISARPSACVNSILNISHSAANKSAPPLTKPRANFAATKCPGDLSRCRGGKIALEVIHRNLQPFGKPDLGRPTQESLRFGNIRAPLLRIILRKRLKNNLRRILEVLANLLGKLQNRDFLRITNVCR